ncbi:hypothetical protein KY305_19005 [Bacillus sp. YC2]|uniref:hypothetical protein n=1 Tax=Bacillus sp. YC2 TaxID=2861287 RepID=UPI001CA749F5|nr:hypothetical protein [Bacillus sp. YC2]MBY8914814.1 hypothetical protein [Bacillus sp. YC2]
MRDESENENILLGKRKLAVELSKTAINMKKRHKSFLWRLSEQGGTADMAVREVLLA